jgi:glutamate racemase
VIGVFDSGVGGLSVLREIRRMVPSADLLYVADRGRAPYGPRPLIQVQGFSHEIARWLIDRGSTTIVVACNTASAAALEELRENFPEVPIVGMEPAVKPAAEATRSGVIAVYATAATFQGRLFESVVSRFTEGVTVLQSARPEWVTLVERGEVDGPEVDARLATDIQPDLDAGVDTLVLGCTHFSFLAPALGRLVGPEIRIIDPAEAVARQTARVAPEIEGSGDLRMAASGDIGTFQRLADLLVGMGDARFEAYP